MEPEIAQGQVIARLEKLERENRILKRIGAVALVVAVGVLLTGQAATRKTLEANEFILKDASEKVRERLFANGQDVAIAFYDTGGHDKVNLGIAADKPYLSFFDASGQRLASLGQLFTHPQLSLFNHSGTEDVVLGFTDEENPLLILGNSAGSEITLQAWKDRALLSIAGKSKGAFLSAESDPPSLELTDKEGFQLKIGATNLLTPRTGETHKTSAASAVMFGKDKKVIWQVP